MSSSSNVTGVWLDSDWERMVEINLPIIKATKTLEFEDEILDHILSYYGEMIFMGDFHIGHEAHSINPFNAHLHFLMKFPHVRVALMGDYLEYAAKSRFIKDEVMNIDEQIDVLVKKLKPIADRIEWILYGNHEERYVKQTDSKKLLEWISEQIGVPDNVYIGRPQRGVYAAVRAKDKVYGIYAHHSLTNARINRSLQLKRAGSQNVFSIIAQGHTHEMAWLPRTFRQLEPVDGELQNVVRRQYLLATGCFMKDPSYGEARSYPYTVVGAPIVRFYANKNKLDAYDLSQDYKSFVAEKGGIPFGADVGVTDWTGIRIGRTYGVERKRLS